MTKKDKDSPTPSQTPTQPQTHPEKQKTVKARYAEFFVCVIGIYVCFLSWGVLQERVTTTRYNGEKFTHFVFLNIIQAIIAAVVSYIFLLLKGLKPEALSTPLIKEYSICAFLSTIASPIGYESLKLIDYPTMMLCKSCKLLPVMIMNFVLYRKVFPFVKYVGVFLITAGVSAFMLLHEQEGKAKSTRTNSLLGLGLVFTNLLIDGVTMSTQDQVFKKYRVAGASMMLNLNVFSSLFMFVYISLFSSQLGEALAFCHKSPEVLIDIFMFGLSGAVGQCFIFHVLEKYGSVSLVTVTVTRKMFSILLSVFWFSHQINSLQWASVCVVFFGLLTEAFIK